MDGIAEEIAAVSHLPRSDLMARWTQVYGHPPPKGISRRLLEYAAAYHLQLRAFGGLKPTVRRKLRQLTKSGHERASPTSRTSESKSLAPGSRLVREWQGRTYTVDVLETGFHCNGHHYNSLSHAARAITGARWSGPRFFGL
jgi:hypothetical protein